MNDVPEGFEDPDEPVMGPIASDQPIIEPQASTVGQTTSDPGHDTEESSRPAEGDLERSGDDPPVEDEPEESEPKQFPEEHRQAFDGLMHIGRLVGEVDAYGHPVVIQTLTMEQMLVAGLIHTKYRGTLGDTRAWQAAVLAGAVQSVDGKALPIPVEDVTTESLMRDRFAYIIKHWFPPTVDVVYTAFLELEGQVEEVLRALGEASG